MRFNRLQVALFAVLLVLSGFAALNTVATVASAQSNISGDLTGTVTDPQGAVLPNAKVTVTNASTGKVFNAVTNGVGTYRVSLLEPGNYKVTATANGFKTDTTELVVSVGSTATQNFKLAVGAQSVNVQVTGDFQTLHVDDAQISTSFSLSQIQSLPNPGNDLTFVAQTTPGAVMNTQGGYGNFSVNGLPGTANTFTINGGYEGDPYLNLNNSGATNLTLGNNDVDTVSVITNSYDAAFGGLGGAQVNEISRHGGNGIHGNASYWWNGRVMNANSWINKQAGNPRSFDNANQWAAGGGGAIKKDKIFWFANTEGIRVILPQTGQVDAPSPIWQSTILGTDNTWDGSALAPYGNLPDNGNSSEASLYSTIFGYYNNARNFSSGQLLANPFDPTVPGDVWLFQGQTTNFGREWLITDRVDFNLSDKDQVFVHSKVDQGVQPTQTSFLDPVFDAESPQPSYEGQLGWTHQLTQNVTNQFLFAASYYRAIFTNTNAKSLAPTIPFVLIPETFATGGDWGAYGGSGAWVGGADYAFPQGRNVTGYQFNDDLSWQKGKHTLKFGYAFRRDDITDYTSSEHYLANAGGENIIYDPGDFAAGFSDIWAERFPQRLSQPVALYVEGFYAQDQWKPISNLTITAGLRVEHNSNPTCGTNCLSSLAGNFADTSTDPSTAYNVLMHSGRHQAFLSQQNFAYEPRVGFSYLIGGSEGKTVLRGGFGMFASYFPAQIVADVMTDIPTVYRATVNGTIYGNPITLDPLQDSIGSYVSGHYQASVSNNAFTSLYSTGACYNGCGSSLSLKAVTAAQGAAFSRPTIGTIQTSIKLPTYEEWNLSLERQIAPGTAISLNYVGNHTYHQPVARTPNAYSSYGEIASLPTARTNPSFGSVTEYYSGGSSNYNGILATLTSRKKWLTLQFNYAYSHALDDGSNGGFDAFGVNPIGQTNPNNLHQDYGNSDYDTRHYVSGSYAVEIPHFGGPKILTAGWEIAGTAFFNSGYPFSVTDSGGASGVNVTYGAYPRAHQLDNSFNHHCDGASHTIYSNGGNPPSPCDFAVHGGSSAGFQHFDWASDFGQQRRNQMWGPKYTDFDLDVAKAFPIPGREGTSFNVGVQFFNVMNHPNFQIPGFDINGGPYSFGVIGSMSNTPTSILGAFLGGDASPRLIQLKATFKF
jgi:hypothetical protein